jgi:PAS domain S-box-containing protein
VEVNDAFMKMTGYTREELIEHSSIDLGLIVNLKRREEVLKQIKEQGSAKNFEMTVRSKTGGILEALTSVETILLKGEKFAINIVYDITDRKKAEDQLEAMNKELEAFSYSVSHDLRAPLRSIIGYTRILEEEFTDGMNEEGKQTLTIVQKNAAKMNELISDLLEFSKIGKMELRKSEVHTGQLVQTVLDGIKNSLQFHANIEIKKLFSVYADQALLTQVWANLISNALKYSAKTKDPKIEIGAVSEKDEVIFYVKDNGAGFDMKYIDKLFGVFQRLHGALEFEGTGVGLSIVKRIIEKHGGRVWAEGKVNEGASFYFSLPT